jgi:hypothetical protein
VSLQWWEVSGSYANALVAAETEERAIELTREHPDVTDRDWGWAELASMPTPPAPPPAEGVYGWWAE